MRDILDCGVLFTPGQEAVLRNWMARLQPCLPRVRLLAVHLCRSEAPPDPQALARMAVALKRYDGCVLAVSPASLAWTRMALAQARAQLATPILLLLNAMTAPAIDDLLSLGATDFMSESASAEELRVRLGRWIGVHNEARFPRSDALLPPAGSRGVTLCSVLHEGTAVSAYPSGVAEPSSCGAPRPTVSNGVLEQALASLRLVPDRQQQAAFRLAKAQVVNGFEREYIRHALSRHGGNVAQAARAACKHRRAFWALMRKHGIDAEPYRQLASAALRDNDD